jgi:hypothetical protein
MSISAFTEPAKSGALCTCPKLTVQLLRPNITPNWLLSTFVATLHIWRSSPPTDRWTCNNKLLVLNTQTRMLNAASVDLETELGGSHDSCCWLKKVPHLIKHRARGKRSRAALHTSLASPSIIVNYTKRKEKKIIILNWRNSGCGCRLSTACNATDKCGSCN